MGLPLNVECFCRTIRNFLNSLTTVCVRRESRYLFSPVEFSPTKIVDESCKSERPIFSSRTRQREILFETEDTPTRFLSAYLLVDKLSIHVCP